MDEALPVPKTKDTSTSLTPIKDELPDTLFVGKSSFGLLGTREKNVALDEDKIDLARGALDIYKQRHVEVIEQMKEDPVGRDSMKVVGKVEVKEILEKKRLLVNFVTTAHRDKTDKRKWLTTMTVDLEPDFDDLAPIDQSNRSKVIAKKDNERNYTIFGGVKELEDRYGERNIESHLRAQGYSSIALVRFADKDRFIDSPGVPPKPAQQLPQPE